MERTGGGSLLSSRLGHSVQRRDWSQAPPCSECRQSALGAKIAQEHGSPRNIIKPDMLTSAADVPLEGTLHAAFHVDNTSWVKQLQGPELGCTKTIYERA